MSVVQTIQIHDHNECDEDNQELPCSTRVTHQPLVYCKVRCDDDEGNLFHRSDLHCLDCCPLHAVSQSRGWALIAFDFKGN